MIFIVIAILTANLAFAETILAPISRKKRLRSAIKRPISSNAMDTIQTTNLR